MFSKSSFKLLVVSNTTPFFAVVQIIYFHDCSHAPSHNDEMKKFFFCKNLNNDHKSILWSMKTNAMLKQKQEAEVLENSQLLRKTWNVILEQCVANYDREIIS